MTAASWDNAQSKPRIQTEAILLAMAGGFIFVNYLALGLVRGDTSASHWVTFVVWTICAISGSIILNRLLPQRDQLLFPLIMFASGWGLIIIDRLAPRFADRQTIWLIVSLIGMLLVATLPQTLRWLRNYRYLWLVFGLALLISTIVLGSNPSGLANSPQLWLGFNGIYFQPSEALKIILVTFLASYLAEQYPSLRAAHITGHNSPLLAFSPRVVGPIILMWGISIVVLIWQRDLGTAILFFIVFIVLLYVASGHWLILLSGAALVAVAAFTAYHLFGVVQLRIDIWWNPWPEADGRAFQLVQSLQAFAAGGIFGQGVSQGSPYYIPVAHSDFVFAALAEEWGLLGVGTVIICLATIVVRGFRISVSQQGRPFRALLAAGLSTTIAVQSLLIMGGVTRVFPLTGITLPYLSYGGSSLLMSFVTLGLLLRLSAGKD